MTTLQLSKDPTVHVGMLIRRPAAEVFQAIVDPAITTKFWFTKSSGRLEPDASVRWEWEMYDVADTVEVRRFEADRLVEFEWGSDGEPRTTVSFELTPLADGTYVTVTQTGFTGDGDAIVSTVAASTGGFAFVLSAMKAWLEHGIVLRLVLDHMPKDLPG